MRKRLLATFGLVSALGCASALGDVVQVPAPPPSQATISLPTRGMTMAQVERQFGAPAERIAAVGQPPISRWVYPASVVYFEHNLVIHAVARRPADTVQ